MIETGLTSRLRLRVLILGVARTRQAFIEYAMPYLHYEDVWSSLLRSWQLR